MQFAAVGLATVLHPVDFQPGNFNVVRGLLGSGLPEGANCWKALGYRAVRSLARGEIGEREARETIVRETRQYAKRQMTWFRRERDVSWFEHTGEPAWQTIADLAAARLNEVRGHL